MIIQDNEQAEIQTPTGPMRVYISRPAAEGRYPGILFYSEIFQVTGPIRRTAAQMASHGFVVAIPEIYHELEPAGCVLAYDEAGAAKGNANKLAKPVEAFDADCRAAMAFLKGHPRCTGKLGAMGICIGGHLAFRAAMSPECLAAACYYPTDIHKGSLGKGGDNSLARMVEISGELLLIFGRQDPHVPLEGRRLIQAGLEQGRVHYQWHEFNAQHAFIRDEGHRYDPALATICMAMTVEMFKRRLADGDVRPARSGAPEMDQC